jgi:hypothetical protein
LGSNAPLTVSSFSLDANGAFRPGQSALLHQPSELEAGTHPANNQAFREFDGVRFSRGRLLVAKKSNNIYLFFDLFSDLTDSLTLYFYIDSCKEKVELSPTNPKPQSLKSCRHPQA